MRPVKKGSSWKKNVILANYLLPDRDNTFAAYRYTADGKMQPSPRLDAQKTAMARETMKLAGLDRPIDRTVDENGKQVAIDAAGAGL